MENKQMEIKDRCVMDAIRDMIIITTDDCKITYVNPAAIQKIGRDITGEYCYDSILNTKAPCKDHPSAPLDSMKNLPREITLYDGSIYDLQISPLIHGDGSLSNIHVFRDISPLKKVETELKNTLDDLKHLSFHDKLTGLYNRAFYDEELKRLDTPRQLPLSLILIDLNALKLTNDAFGHGEGDKLLEISGKILRQSCRDEDIIARIGGDEFAILLPKTHERDALKIVDRIVSSCLNEKVQLIQPSLSIGLATKCKPDQPMDEVFKMAEDKMYRNKLKEGNTIRNTIISSILKALRKMSHETESHALRTERLALQLGRVLGLSERNLDALSHLAVLHDIGKIGIPSSILTKTGPLTDKEWITIKKHSEIGYHIVKSSPELSFIADAILCHHERWDGKGYPQGISGNEIPLLARIIGVIDAYDVMVHDRPYRPAISTKNALKELEKCANTQFDPVIVRTFVEMMAAQNTNDK